jgi:hypothetical protein
MGNFQSYSVGQDQEQPEDAINTSGSLAHDGGTYTITINGNGSVSSSSGATRVDTGKDLSPYAADDWRGTARTPYGTPTNDVTEDSIVNIGGVSAQVGSFVKTGILVKQGDSYVLATGEGQPQEAPQQQDQEQQEQTTTESGGMPDDVVEAINSAMDGMPDSAVQKGSSIGIAAALGEASFDDVVKGVAQSTGMDPANAGQRVQFVVSAYQAQADNYLTAHQGIATGDLSDFYDFCRQPENKGALQNAIQKQVYGNSMSAWGPLVDKYMTNTAPSAAALKANGFETKTSPNGEELVRIQGVWMSTKAAAQAGYI